MMSWVKRYVPSSAILAVAALALVASSASALPLRSPQVPFTTGPLQGYLNTVDPGINCATDQVDAQSWSTSITGNADFTLMLKTGLGNNATFGVYNSGAPVGPIPPLFQVFPGGAVPGWYAALHFAGGNLTVSLFNQFAAFMGSTFYPGVNPNSFGFYIQGPCGTWFSQDTRNGPGPQMLTYGSLGNPGDFWLCWEECLYVNPASTFDGVVVNVQSVHPTPVRAITWGNVKSTYR